MTAATAWQNTIPSGAPAVQAGLSSGDVSASKPSEMEFGAQ